VPGRRGGLRGDWQNRDALVIHVSPPIPTGYASPEDLRTGHSRPPAGQSRANNYSTGMAAAIRHAVPRHCPFTGLPNTLRPDQLRPDGGRSDPDLRLRRSRSPAA